MFSGSVALAPGSLIHTLFSAYVRNCALSGSQYMSDAYEGNEIL
jgi:hypothetical protein